MTQFSLKETQIKAIATNPLVYNKGVAYYAAKRVKNLAFSPYTGILSAKVLGTWSYAPQVEFSEAGAIIDYECTCPAFNQYEGACKHIIATLKAAQETQQSRENPELQNKAVQELLASFAASRPEGLRQELNLEVELEITGSRRVSTCLQLKLGTKRLYVVKDMKKLLTSFITGQELEFGKHFTFDPTNHIFKAEDQGIITLLQEMYEQHLALEEMQGSYYSNYSTNLFEQKSLPLTGYYLTKFFDTLGDKVFQLTLGNNSPRPACVIRGGLPLEFSLADKDQHLAFALNSDELPLQLTSDGSYYVYRHNVYLASPVQKDVLPPIIKTFRQGFTPALMVPTAQKERFASEVLPVIGKIGSVNIEPKLAEKFNQAELQASIYFDRVGDRAITARLEFHYGDIVINPFSASRETPNLGAASDAILIRSVEQERRILNSFEQAEFMVAQGKIYLEDEEKIFDFTLNWLPQLQELADIYYSEEFKLKVRTSSTFSGRIRLDENLDLLELSIEYSDIDQGELTDIFQSLHLKKKYHRLKDGSFLDLQEPGLQNVAQLLDNLDLDASDLKQKVLNLPKFRAMYIDSFLRQANLPGLQRNMAFKQLVQSILEPQDAEFVIPTALEPVLRDYQKTGFKWLKTLAAFGLGGILADDMGLGKTLQVLAFILSEKLAKEDSTPAPALVIAPTSLIYNWREEADKFTPSLQVLVIDGSPREREAELESVANYDLVVVSYPILRRDIDNFTKLDFSYCFLDEAQHIKNPQTLNAKSVQAIKARGYFALTGTPIENSLSELWSIFNFIMPGYLLSFQEFRRKYEIPILKGEDTQPLVELSRHANPFILRRLKKDVLKELPDKIETQLNAPLTEQQKKIYLAFLQDAKQQIAQEIASVGFERSHIKILAALTRLRQICCHPGMFIEDYAGESGKMQLFQEVLTDALDSGHRMLVFSQFTSMLDIIQSYLTTEGIEHFYLNGSTKAVERTQMAHSFNAGSGKVFLISLKAGGTGLNLTGADMVVHFDPWWNPAVEDQATDRAHRIGQKNVVQVVKLITQGTIEEKVSALQAKKKKLIEAVIQPGETMLSKLSEEELRNLFDLT